MTSAEPVIITRRVSIAPGLAQRIATRRLQLGLRQEDVEQLAGLPRTTLSRYERGTGAPMPHRRRLARIAAALDTTVEELARPHELPPPLPEGAKVVAYRNGRGKRPRGGRSRVSS